MSPSRTSQWLRQGYSPNIPTLNHLTIASNTGPDPLNYIEKGTRGNIAYATHQCARYSSDPKMKHGQVARWLIRYLKGTKHQGTIFTPDESKGLEVYVDATFLQDWDPRFALEDPETARSRHGFAIKYAGCTIMSKSQLQSEIYLSATEAEHVGISYTLRDTIPIIEAFCEMQEYGFKVHPTMTKVHCRVFKDNSGALEMAKIHKSRPRTISISTLNCTTSDHTLESTFQFTRSGLMTSQQTCSRNHYPMKYSSKTDTLYWVGAPSYNSKDPLRDPTRGSAG
jgi:hypothetical protein